MNVDEAIRLFSKFLNASWDIVIPSLANRTYTSSPGTPHESSIGDWLQANWELLVEQKVLTLEKHLEVYSDGADFHGSSSRIIDNDILPEIMINILLKESGSTDVLNNEIIISGDFKFDRLVAFKNDFYVESPPFDHVLVFDSKKEVNFRSFERVFSIEDVKFELRK